ncbi:MAG: malto-oligosyltrehalose trehalohydrolase [Nitrospirota bacterium]|nr:malto-oligosyltrehalose trehalohydrolase [Nitrospirota bacterium]
MTEFQSYALDIGATFIQGKGVHFKVWAPYAGEVAVHISAPRDIIVPLQPCGSGYFEGHFEEGAADLRYMYVLDGTKTRPDPASRFQPDGVHGPSAVIDPAAFNWTDREWRGVALQDYIIYELHVGTFTEPGTFDAVIPRLQYLKHDVGVTAVELMPVAQFPGARNWGYDGAHPFAPHNSYGGPAGLKRLIDACHAQGLAVVLDVVYNHLGPEGNYLQDYGPYFTDRYRTPWGQAINYDGRDSDPVRRYFISNALYWIREYHIDALRLDAIHGIFDFSARHVLQELTEVVHGEAERLRRSVQVIAESDLNDTRVIKPAAFGGHGCDAQWNDDFHHALRVVLTKESQGYYRDFTGMADLVQALQHGFVYTGRYSEFRRRLHGHSSELIMPAQFIVFSQNHDQVGNRADGERLSTQISLGALKAAAALVLLSPNIPLLFMGEEYGERAPFLYFIDHSDPGLIEAVRKGRREEFAHFGWREEDIPDPYARSTFERSRIHTEVSKEGRSDHLLRWYRALTNLRKRFPVLGAGTKGPTHDVWWSQKDGAILVVHRRMESGPEALLLIGLNGAALPFTCRRAGSWRLELSGNSVAYGGEGEGLFPPTLDIPESGHAMLLPPYAVAVYMAAGPY